MTADRVRGLGVARAAAALLIGALVAAFAASPADAALKHYDGTVSGTNQSKGTFRIETQTGTVKFKVNGRTEFERIAGGLAGMRKGDDVEVDAKKKLSGLVARQVEPRGGGGAEDNGGGNDDPPGDDNGGGHDDGPSHD